MSAYVVSDAHINAIVAFCAGQARGDWPGAGLIMQDLSRFLQFNTANELGEALLAANVASVNYRYKEQGGVPVFQYKPQKVPSAVEVLKLLDCLEYQSCERPDYLDKEGAFWLLQAIRRAAIRVLPGYEEAQRSI